LAAFTKFGNNSSWPRNCTIDSTQLNAAWLIEAHKDHRRPSASSYSQVVRTRRCPPPPRRPYPFAVIQQFLQKDRAARNTLEPTSAKTHRNITIAVGSRSCRWTKDDLRAGAELGSVAAVGVIIGWLSGFGIIVSAAASIALFWLMLAGAYLLELRRQ
jgi:hypothetical protein